MRIILTGGGTGGHIYPNVAVIEEIRKNFPNSELLYIGSESGMEAKILEKINVGFESVKTGKLRRYFSWENFKDLLKVPIGVFQARKIIKNFKPEIVFSKGGFVSVPVVFAAWTLKVPVVIHESDISPGLANKLCFRFAKKILLSFEESKQFLKKKYLPKTAIVGGIVRPEILSGEKETGYKLTKLDRRKKTILVMGGSQGAKQINEIIWGTDEEKGAADELLKRYQIVHVVGKGNLNLSFKKVGYCQFDFVNKELKHLYAIADLVVSRGGAGSLGELAALGKSVIIVPINSAASRGEQDLNANYYVKKMGWSLLKGDVKVEDFILAVDVVLKTDKSQMKQPKESNNALVEIVKILEKVVKG